MNRMPFVPERAPVKQNNVVYIIWLHNTKDCSKIIWEIYATEKLARESMTNFQALNNDPYQVFSLEGLCVREEIM